jgi:hypothetical protein
MKLVVLSSYCDTPHKLQVLLTNVQTLRTLGCVHICIISHIKLPDNIVDLVDYVIYTHENFVIDISEKYLYPYSNFICSNTNYSYSYEMILPDYGYSALNHLKRGCDMFYRYDYSHLIYITYDLKIDDTILFEIDSYNITDIIKSYTVGNHIVSLHLCIIPKNLLIQVSDAINFNEYISNSEYIAETYFYENIIKKINSVISDIPLVDLISSTGSAIFGTYDVTESGNPIPFQIYLGTNPTLSVMIVPRESNLDLTLIVDGFMYTLSTRSSPLYIDTGMVCNYSTNLICMYDNQEFDISSFLHKSIQLYTKINKS